MEVTLDEVRDLLAHLAWTEVQWRNPGSGMEQHWYVIRDREVPVDLYWAIVRLVKREGYRGRYTTSDGRVLTNWYLDLDGWSYFAIPPKQICRTQDRQHTPLPEQPRLLDHKEET